MTLRRIESAGCHGFGTLNSCACAVTVARLAPNAGTGSRRRANIFASLLCDPMIRTAENQDRHEHGRRRQNESPDAILDYKLFRSNKILNNAAPEVNRPGLLPLNAFECATLHRSREDDAVHADAEEHEKDEGHSNSSNNELVQRHDITPGQGINSVSSSYDPFRSPPVRTTIRCPVRNVSTTNPLTWLRTVTAPCSQVLRNWAPRAA
jgi:hypothetical protein